MAFVISHADYLKEIQKFTLKTPTFLYFYTVAFPLLFLFSQRIPHIFLNEFRQNNWFKFNYLMPNDVRLNLVTIAGYNRSCFLIFSMHIKFWWFLSLLIIHKYFYVYCFTRESFGYTSSEWRDPPSNDDKYIRKRAMQINITLQCGK